MAVQFRVTIALLAFCLSFASTCWASDPLRISTTPLVSPLVTAWREKYLSMYPGAFFEIEEAASETSADKLIARQVDFALSLVDFSDAEYASQADLQMIPLVAIPMVVGYGLPTLDNNLNLSVQLMADIFSGHVVKWNDAAIQTLNEGAALPDTPIRIVVQKGVSDTTFLLTSALCRFSAEWNQTFGVFYDFMDLVSSNQSNATFIFCDSDHELSVKVATLEHTIGYVPLTEALEQSLPYAAMVTSNGLNSSPNPLAAAQAMDAVDLSSRLTVDVFNMVGNYPLYTMVYAGLRMATMPNCDR